MPTAPLPRQPPGCIGAPVWPSRFAISEKVEERPTFASGLARIGYEAKWVRSGEQLREALVEALDLFPVGTIPVEALEPLPSNTARSRSIRYDNCGLFGRCLFFRSHFLGFLFAKPRKLL